MEPMIQVPLNLPNVRIVSVGKTDRGEWLIRVESTVERAVWAGDWRLPRLGRGGAFATLAYFRSGRVDRVEAQALSL
jgi:hypothetical protein